MSENYRIFNPSNDNINEVVRLIIYDNDTEKFIVKEVIEENQEYEVEQNLFTGNWDFKYKYQVKRDGRWVDFGKYTRILPEKLTEDGIKYLFYPNESSEKLVVVFQAINKKQSYNYIKVLKNFNINKLFIKDDYGLDELTKSSYYLGTKKSLKIAEYTQNLLSKIAEENNINKKNIIFAGSSKGGYAALYHGYIFGAGYIIPGGPQILLGDYLFQTNPMSIRYEIFKSIVGDFTAENKEWANSLLYNVLKGTSSPYPKTKIHIGYKEPHYEEHVVPFMNWVKEIGIPDVELDAQDYNTHEELAKYYPIFLEEQIRNFIEKDNL